jgi:tetratricopeptide (TPR) repeat protein
MNSINNFRLPRLKSSAIYIAWALLLVVAVFAYKPGLGGPFLFDDFFSLADIGDLGGVRNWFTFKAYVFGGYSGPTGRPLALLSFLIDANNWPTDPWPFKRTNLILHLINGVLLGIVTAKILRVLGFRHRSSGWLALVCAGLWLLHPFLVSTTLYVVQRMAQMSTLFVFVGIIFYMHGRTLIALKPTKAYITMSVALVSCTFLAMISKENGILLPVLVLVLEGTIYASRKPGEASLDRRWAALFLYAPFVIIIAYLCYRTFSFGLFEIRPLRGISTYERVLTEFRVLIDYLKHWFVPELYTTGVFQDHFASSTNLFSPVTTILSAIFHVALIVVCVIKRHKWPLFAFGILFFYASHLLESTVLNLELYFEHRNYLAAAFLFPPLIVQVWHRVEARTFSVISLSLLLLLAGFTHYTSGVWASFSTMVEASARKAPTSARAQRQYSFLLFKSEQYNQAMQVVDAAIVRVPDNEQLHIWRTVMLCNLGVLSADEFDQMKLKVGVRNYDPRASGLYVTLVDSVISGVCPEVPLQDVRELFTDMLRVPLNADTSSLRHSELKYFVGLVSIHLQEPELALLSFKESLQADSNASKAMQMAALMASNGYNQEALQLSEIALFELNVAESRLLDGQQVSESDVKAFQETVLLDIEANEIP